MHTLATPGMNPGEPHVRPVREPVERPGRTWAKRRASARPRVIQERVETRGWARHDPLPGRQVRGFRNGTTVRGYTLTMRPRIFVALAALLVIGSVAGLGAFVLPQRSEHVYTVAQVTAGLASNPGAWIGRVVTVRGRAIFPGGRAAVPCCSALLVDPTVRTQHIQLVWKTVSPFLRLMLSIPALKSFVAGEIGGDRTYRVRITRITRLVPASGLPSYYPYTSKTLAVQDDSAVLVTDLD